MGQARQQGRAPLDCLDLARARVNPGAVVAAGAEHQSSYSRRARGSNRYGRRCAGGHRLIRSCPARANRPRPAIVSCQDDRSGLRTRNLQNRFRSNLENGRMAVDTDATTTQPQRRLIPRTRLAGSPGGSSRRSAAIDGHSRGSRIIPPRRYRECAASRAVRACVGHDRGRRRASSDNRRHWVQIQVGPLPAGGASEIRLVEAISSRYGSRPRVAEVRRLLDSAASGVASMETSHRDTARNDWTVAPSTAPGTETYWRATDSYRGCLGSGDLVFAAPRGAAPPV